MSDSDAEDDVFGQVRHWSIVHVGTVPPPLPAPRTPRPVAGTPAAPTPWQVALMGHPFPRRYKKGAFIFCAPDVVTEAVQYNQRGHEPGSSKEMRLVAPHWRLLAVLQARDEQQARVCADEWSHSTRGRDSKKRRALVLARKYGMPCYTEDAAPPGGTTRRYLKAVEAPPAVVAAYDHLASPPADDAAPWTIGDST
jgi:hypothetical protein